MRNKRKGTGTRPAPKINQSNYNRVSKLCLTIMLICIVIYIAAYYRSSRDIMICSFGGTTASGLILAAITPIKEDE